jgi:hypothetical protein
VATGGALAKSATMWRWVYRSKGSTEDLPIHNELCYLAVTRRDPLTRCCQPSLVRRMLECVLREKTSAAGRGGGGGGESGAPSGNARGDAGVELVRLSSRDAEFAGCVGVAVLVSRTCCNQSS